MSLRSNIPRPDEPIAVQVKANDGTMQWLANKTWYNWFSILTYQDIINIDIHSQLAFLIPNRNVDDTNRRLEELRAIEFAQPNQNIHWVEQSIKDLWAVLFSLKTGSSAATTATITDDHIYAPLVTGELIPGPSAIANTNGTFIMVRVQ